ncbi:hypothetical protein IWQ61_004843 [Dispira simplex]|nr:hypothetical protein IWQ61_004843 [Dispira simplex]
MKVSVTFLVLVQLAYLVHATPLPADKGKSKAPEVPPAPGILGDKFPDTSRSPADGKIAGANTGTNHERGAGSTSGGNLGNQPKDGPEGDGSEKATVETRKSPQPAPIDPVNKASKGSEQGDVTSPQKKTGKQPTETTTTEGDPPLPSFEPLPKKDDGSSTTPSIPTEAAAKAQAQVEADNDSPKKGGERRGSQTDGKETKQVGETKAPDSGPDTTSSTLVDGDHPQITLTTPDAEASSLSSPEDHTPLVKSADNSPKDSHQSSTSPPKEDDNKPTGNDKRQRLTAKGGETATLMEEIARLDNQPSSTASRGDSDTTAGSSHPTKAPGQPLSHDQQVNVIYGIFKKVFDWLKDAKYSGLFSTIS